jgi:hypothetical protein
MWKKSTLIMAFLLALGAVTASAQDSADQKKSRKEIRAERLKASRERLAQLAKDSTLILEANILRNRYGNSYPVTGDNFILVDGERVVLQTASNWGGPGFNGLGGITLEGRITQYEYDIDEKGPISIVADISLGGVGFATLRFSISSDGSATATYYDNWGGRVTFSGIAASPGDSRVFEGMPLL